jgi:predicted TIM-barrel fold metal-dependent hydrolase
MATLAWDQTLRPQNAVSFDALPPALGNSLDLDSHEMIPTHMWAEQFGDAGEMLRPIAKLAANLAENTMVRDDLKGDDQPINAQTVWNLKGPGAPGAIDHLRRPAVLDAMGVRRQLMFPSFGTFGLFLLFNPDAHEYFGYDRSDNVDRIGIGRAVLKAHNRWAGRVMKDLPESRIRPVALLAADQGVPELMAEAEEALASGIRALNIPGGMPPCNTSPADRALAPFWKLCEDHDIPVVIHLGTEFSLLASNRWHSNVPEFVPANNSSLEFPIEPFRGSTMQLLRMNFLSAMILGGVFERHPRLRFAAIECAAHWVGPLADSVDLWGEQFHGRLSNSLSMKPSAYIARHVRVTPYVFEPVDQYIRRYPHLADVYCFSSDYPHREGGREAKQRFYERIGPLGSEIAEKFFVTNAELILPA